MRIFPEFPLLRREVLGVLRTRRAFWLLLISVLVSTLIPLLFWPRPEVTSFFSFQNRLCFMTLIFTQLTAAILIIPAFTAGMIFTQLTAAILIIPAFTAGAVSGERERGTYELLYSTLLSPFSIVVSKILASLSYLFLVLSATAPSVCILCLLGGISFETVLRCYAITFTAVLMTGVVCLTTSMRSRRTSHAAVRGIVWTIIWNGGIVGLYMLTIFVVWVVILEERREPPAGFLLAMFALSPYSAMGAQLVPEEFSGTLGNLPLGPFSLYLIYAGTITALHFFYLLRKVRTPDLAGSRRRERRLARKPKRGRQRRRRRPLVVRYLGFLGESGIPLLRNPIFLKEIRSEFFGKAWYFRLSFLASLAIFIAVALFNDHVLSRIIPQGCLALGLLVLLIPGVVASAFTRELEQGNLDLLRGTLLPLRAILSGKYAAGLIGALGIFAAAALVAMLGPFFSSVEGVRPAALLGSYLAVFTVIPLACVFSAAVSICCSVLSRRTLGALLGSYIALTAIFLGVPIAVAVLAESNAIGSWSRELEDVLTLLNPFATLPQTCLRFFYGSENPLSAPALLGYHLLCFGLATLLLWGVSLGLLERRWGRDR